MQVQHDQSANTIPAAPAPLFFPKQPCLIFNQPQARTGTCKHFLGADRRKDSMRGYEHEESVSKLPHALTRLSRSCNRVMAMLLASLGPVPTRKVAP